jgi:hypothetical protein
MKSRTGLYTLAAVLFLVALGNRAVAQSQPPDYSLNLNGYCEELCANVNSGWPDGEPASGNATFEQQQVSFNFLTLNALSYQNGEDNYYAQFGYGGTFELTAPMGTFEGVVTSGTAYVYGGSTAEGAEVDFEGHWNTGVYATGEAYVDFCGDCIDPGFSFHVDMTPGSTTPEPGTFALLGTSALGVIGWMRRRVI